MRIQRITREISELDHKNWQLLKSLNTPSKIQDFINTLKFDFRDGHKVDRSVQGTLRSRKTDCAGGAVFAAAALSLQGRKPLLLDLKTIEPDFDHVLALFQVGKYWGAISKTNHAVLRYREPIYESVRELVMSYFHEYFLYNGKKTLRSYSKPFDLSRYGTRWFTDKNVVMDIIHALDNYPHTNILTPAQIKNLRKADKIEIKAGKIVEYK
ncbi:MAG: hypothetical protein AAB758_00445 [Patescibacteria group bacterium]